MKNNSLKVDKLSNAILGQGNYADIVNLWNCCKEPHIYYTGKDLDDLVKSRNYTPSELIEKCVDYHPCDLFFIETDFGFESFEYLEEQSFFDFDDLARTLIEKDEDGGYHFVREILNEK